MSYGMSCVECSRYFETDYNIQKFCSKACARPATVPYAYTEAKVPCLPQYATEGQKYSCPECENELILRQGDLRIAHFAHKPGAACLAEGVSRTGLIGTPAHWDSLTEELRRRLDRAIVYYFTHIDDPLPEIYLKHTETRVKGLEVLFGLDLYRLSERLGLLDHYWSTRELPFAAEMSSEENDFRELSAALDELDVDYNDFTELRVATQFALNSRFIIGEWSFNPQSCDEAIKYYFTHLDNPAPPFYINYPEPRVTELKALFNIDLSVLKVWLEQIRNMFDATGETPFDRSAIQAGRRVRVKTLDIKPNDPRFRAFYDEVDRLLQDRH